MFFEKYIDDKISQKINEISKNCRVHKKTSKTNNKETIYEFLFNHSVETINTLEYLYFDGKLENIINNLFDELSFSLLVNALFFHDVGKINPKFQSEKMNNPSKIAKKMPNSNHSKYSAYIYLSEMLKQYGMQLVANNDIAHLIDIIDFAYIIERHHSPQINGYYEFFDKIKDCENDYGFDYLLNTYNITPLNFDLNEINCTYFDFMKNIIDTFHEKNIFKSNELQHYIKVKFSYSLLTVSDNIASNNFMTNNNKFKFHSQLNVDNYFNGELFQKINSYKNKEFDYENNDINKIRSDIGIELLNTLPNKNSKISSIEGPCGVGKTNLSLITACSLIKNSNNTLNGIVYTSPFNAITDQNVETFKGYFKDVQTINSTTIINSINYQDEENEKNIKVLNYKLNNYGFIATSHIHLFDILFGKSKANLINLIFLANKVVILDEIQAYNPFIWKCMINTLDMYSKLLNIEFVLMSATFPNLEKLGDNITITNLIPNKKTYFSNPLFKDRVKFKYIGEINDLNEIIKEKDFYNNKKVLYEFITKSTANEFYDLIKNIFPQREIYLLDGDVKSSERKNIITKTKESKEIIIISTQVIEAGVDLDFDFGFKDFSLYDSEIQFLGRINRSCLNKGYALFFSYDNKRIYEKDVRFYKTIKDIEIQEAIKHNDNEKLYAFALEKIEEKSKQSYQKMNYETFLCDCKTLMFEEVYKKMELISPTANIYIAHTKKININNLEEENFNKLINKINEISNKYNTNIIEKSENLLTIDGISLWNLSIKIKEDKSLSFDDKFLYKKDIEVLKNYFTYTFYVGKYLPPYIEKISQNFYFTKYEKYIKDGKINRASLKENNNFL